MEGVILNVISTYAHKLVVMEEKENFWSELEDMVESLPKEERLMVEADFNRHVGEGNLGDKEVRGRYGVRGWNAVGKMEVDFEKKMVMVLVNTYFKREEHRITYKSGERVTQVNYL